MNKKRRRLTLAALAAFGLIIFFHYCDPWFHQGQLEFGAGGAWHGGRYHAGSIEPLIADVRMPLFVLAVVYAGLFFLFGGKDAEPVPRRPVNWRRINTVILALLVVAGTGAGITYSLEQERRRESVRRSAIAAETNKREMERINGERERRRAAQLKEWEDSKHRITLSELKCNLRADTSTSFIGSVRNGSAKYTLTSMDLLVTVYEVQKNGSLEVVGDEPIRLEFKNFGVPPGQTRQVSAPIHFHSIWSNRVRSSYVVTAIRGSDNPFLIP